MSRHRYEVRYKYTRRSKWFTEFRSNRKDALRRAEELIADDVEVYKKTREKIYHRIVASKG